MRRDLILEEAHKLFSGKGYSLSLSEVAKGAGIRKQTLYNYFSSKDELLLEVIKNETISYFDSKRSEFESYMHLDAELRLSKMFFSIMDYFEDRSKLLFWRWIILIESVELKSKCGQVIKQSEGRFLNLLNQTFSQAMENEEIREQPIKPLIHTYIALIYGTLDGTLMYENVIDAKPFKMDVWGTFWSGIKKI